MAKDFKSGSYTNEKVTNNVQKKPQVIEIIDEVKSVHPAIDEEAKRLIAEKLEKNKEYGIVTPRSYEKTVEDLGSIVDNLTEKKVPTKKNKI